MKVGEIKTWLGKELSPLAWQRVLMRLLPSFREEGLFFHTITDDDVLSEKLLRMINKTLKEVYQTSLPKAV